jgi:hypothetical protein
MINSSNAKINLNLFTYSVSTAHYALHLGCKILYSEIIVNSEIRTKHINTFRGQDVDYFSVNLRGTDQPHGLVVRISDF